MSRASKYYEKKTNEETTTVIDKALELAKIEGGIEMYERLRVLFFDKVPIRDNESTYYISLIDRMQEIVNEK